MAGSVVGVGVVAGFEFGGGGGVTGGLGVEGTEEPKAPVPLVPPPLGTPPPAPPSPPAAVSISSRPASLAESSLLPPGIGLLTAISKTRFPGFGGFDSPTKISLSEAIARPVAPVPLISPLACCWIAAWVISLSVGSGSGKAPIKGQVRIVWARFTLNTLGAPFDAEPTTAISPGIIWTATPFGPVTLVVDLPSRTKRANPPVALPCSE